MLTGERGTKRASTIRFLEILKPAESREDLEEIAFNDLPGPAGGPEEEINKQPVSDRYLVGVPVPKGWKAVVSCSSEPLTAERNPDPEGRMLHAAACHACLFAPETSCERENKFSREFCFSHRNDGCVWRHPAANISELDYCR